MSNEQNTFYQKQLDLTLFWEGSELSVKFNSNLKCLFEAKNSRNNRRLSVIPKLTTHKRLKSTKYVTYEWFTKKNNAVVFFKVSPTY
jgi:hypothetical protein